MSDDLTTWANAQSYIGAGDDDETLVGGLITAASVMINNYCSRKLLSRTYTADDTDDVFYDANNDKYILLTQYPVTAITGLYQDQDREFGADTEITSDEYVLNPDRGKITLTEDIFYKGVQVVKCLYTAGYVTVPKDLEIACLIIVDYLYKGFSNHMWGVRSTGVDDKRIDYRDNIPVQARILLQPYRKAVI
jgi:uncharacterized phiE125 gp8 family phage protein